MIRVRFPCFQITSQIQTLHNATSYLVTNKALVACFPVKRNCYFVLRFLLRFNVISLFYITRYKTDFPYFFVVNSAYNNRKFTKSWSNNLSYRFNHLALRLLATHTGYTLFIFSTPYGLKTLPETLHTTKGGLLMGYL